MLAALQAFFLALPSLLGLIKTLLEDFREIWQETKDELLRKKLQDASKKATTGDTSGYEDTLRGKK
jgi:hypothetical protein